MDSSSSFLEPTSDSTPGPYVCTSCQDIDLEAVIRAQTPRISPRDRNSRIVTVGGQSSWRINGDPECALCTFLSSPRIRCRPIDDNDGPLEFCAFQLPYSLDYLIGDRQTGWDAPQPDAVARLSSSSTFLVTCTENNRPRNTVIGFPEEAAVCQIRGLQDLLLQPQPVVAQFDHVKVRTWLLKCKENGHALCARRSVPIPGLKLIDCYTSTIVEAVPDMEWVALSYVWALANSEEFEPLPAQRKDVCPDTQVYVVKPLPSKIPRVVRDSIEVVRELGYRYLWVDQFCIDQDNVTELNDQIGKMDLIYQGAQLTIVAASNQAGLPGTGRTQRTEQASVSLPKLSLFTTGTRFRTEIRDSVWCSRAWTFQEQVLSRRVLYFMDDKAVFQCAETDCCDNVGGAEYAQSLQDMKCYEQGFRLRQEGDTSFFQFSLLSESMLVQELPDERPLSPWHLLNIYFRLVYNYTNKSMSFESDSLNGFRGILKLFGKLNPAILSLEGLPFVNAWTGCEPGIQDTLFLAGLIWFHFEHPTRRHAFPSWTWAGWGGEAIWPWISVDPSSRVQQYLADTLFYVTWTSIEGACGHKSTLQGGGLQAFFRLFPNCTSHSAKYIGPVVPAHMFSLNPKIKAAKSGLQFQIGQGATLTWHFGALELERKDFIKDLIAGRLECILLGSNTNRGRFFEVYFMIIRWDDRQSSFLMSGGTGERVAVLIFKPDGDVQSHADKVGDIVSQFNTLLFQRKSFLLR
jgi:hypothetical protein